MFSQTAYEAFYTYIGLYLHEASIKIITSQEVLLGILALLFGILFFFSAWSYFKKYLPGAMSISGKRAGMGIFIKIMVCFLLGVSILKAKAPSEVKNFKRIPWSDNKYIQTKIPNVEESYNVSFVFDLISRTSEELAYLASMIVDKLFQQTNSNLEAPDAFYKAVLYAGSQTLEDPHLRALIDLYTAECFAKILPKIGLAKKLNKVDEFFREHGVVDRDLQAIPITSIEGEKITCLDLKDKVRSELALYAYQRSKKLARYSEYLKDPKVRKTFTETTNFLVSSALKNYYLEKTESSVLGVQKGAEVPGGLASFLLGLKRTLSFDGFLNLVGLKKLEGANLTATRAKQFSEYLKRAPHIKGMVKLFLIALFPLAHLLYLCWKMENHSFMVGRVLFSSALDTPLDPALSSHDLHCPFHRATTRIRKPFRWDFPLQCQLH